MLDGNRDASPETSEKAAAPSKNKRIMHVQGSATKRSLKTLDMDFKNHVNIEKKALRINTKAVPRTCADMDNNEIIYITCPKA